MNTGSTTSFSASNVIFNVIFDGQPGTMGFGEPPAGVREPRNPVIPPDTLVARKQPDGSWAVPAAIAGSR